MNKTSSKLNISTVMCTYDTYDFLWPNYMKTWNKYWEPDTHNIVIGETISHTEPNFDYVTPGKIREDGKDLWGTRMKMALDMVTTDYVFVMLIDFYLWEPITYQHIEDELIFLSIQQGNKVVMDENAPRAYNLQHLAGNYYKFENHSDYQTSLMPSVWRTDFLKQSLNDNDDPWIFETVGTDRIKGQDNGVYIHMRNDPIFYNVIRKRKYIPEQWGKVKWTDFVEKEGLDDITPHLTNDLTDWS